MNAAMSNVMNTLTLGIPSKGRLMEATAELLAKAGFTIDRTGSERGYRGKLMGLANVEIAFLSASEIAGQLRDGRIQLGVTGEDLLREKIPPDDDSVDVALRLGFGPARVIVAVPECWLDVAAMADLDDVAEQFYRSHGRRIRVATKYIHLTRRWFAAHGVTGYRIVESAGATEGAPAAGTAELIVDITTTGSTLAANNLRILDDGLILESCAVLAARHEILADSRLTNLVAGLSKAL
jgi:ATP phosphoribosyltransferase